MSEQKKVKLNWQLFPIELLVITAYLLLGFISQKKGNPLWHPGWIIFFASPLYHWLVDVIVNKRVKGVPTTVATFVAIIAFVLMGLLGNLWHPGWLVFFLIPITGSFEFFLTGGFRSRIEKHKKAFRDSVEEELGIHVEEDDGHIE